MNRPMHRHAIIETRSHGETGIRSITMIRELQLRNHITGATTWQTPEAFLQG